MKSFWADLRRSGSIRDRECSFRNRNGKLFTILLSSEVIQLNGVPHMLSMALDITGRKQSEAGLRASEARLRESEARFQVAFQASPVFINILRMTDATYVWANDAFVNRLGYSREEVLGHPSSEFGLWENPAEQEAAWTEMRNGGSVRQRECRWRNRQGEPLYDSAFSRNDQVQWRTSHSFRPPSTITLRKRAGGELLKSAGT